MKPALSPVTAVSRAFQADAMRQNLPPCRRSHSGSKGRAKEAAGAVSGNESLTQEGQAQQDKAAALRDAAAKEAEAEKARAQATAAEAEQRSHQ